MRVLLTTPYDLAVPGGVNRHARDLLAALTRRGIEARLIGPSSAATDGRGVTHAAGAAGENDDGETDPRVVALGRVQVTAMNGAQSRVTLDWRIGGAVRTLLREFRPDVIHLQEPFLPLLNTFCLRQAQGAACVGTFHTFSETSRGYLWAWPWCRWVGRRLHARIAVSAAARDFAAQFHPGAYALVPSGVRAVAPSHRRPAGGVRRPVRALFVGRCDEPRKGFGALLAALRRLETETPGEFALTVAGPGAEAWQGGAAVAGLPVWFVGRLTDAELSAAYAAADVCVVPSLGGESFGLVALEALAHGVPVVASQIRGYAEWLERAEVGLLVAPGDAAALAGALRSVAAEASRHASWAQRAVALAGNYEWDAIAERTVAVYAAARASNATDRRTS
jgi:phosphatidylinositol alpha-mannosyltransferase